MTSESFVNKERKHPDVNASSPEPYLYYGPLAEGEREGYGHWLQVNHHYYYAGDWQNDIKYYSDDFRM